MDATKIFASDPQVWSLALKLCKSAKVTFFDILLFILNFLSFWFYDPLGGHQKSNTDIRNIYSHVITILPVSTKVIIEVIWHLLCKQWPKSFSWLTNQKQAAMML